MQGKIFPEESIVPGIFPEESIVPVGLGSSDGYSGVVFRDGFDVDLRCCLGVVGFGVSGVLIGGYGEVFRDGAKLGGTGDGSGKELGHGFSQLGHGGFESRAYRVRTYVIIDWRHRVHR
ncbi:hypothetical protein Tco_0749172 [Tanacetum coccineum]|uniref:Uncharacterized protein n=1 Tax=Tanacetum coccineum TaxID=301880 RepID=A0ABQ4YYY8_9ASTR